jgi:DNA-binding winged helix-turn-helix (wHTH) protein
MTERKCLVFSFADVQVREREFSIVRNGEVLPVEPKAFRVLLFLLRNPQKLITKEELLDAVWGDTAVSENSLTRSIALLRRLLADDTHEPRYIATVPTVGYRFLCNVRVAEEGSAELNAQGSNPAVKPSADDQPAPAADGERKGAAMTGILAGIGVAVLLLAAFLTWAIGGGRVFGHAAHPGGKTASNARVVPLTTVAGNVWGQAFSPDGKQIAFMWDGENPVKGDLYVQLVGGQRPLRLTHTQSGYICCADWSPDGQEIAFGRCTDDGGGCLCRSSFGWRGAQTNRCGVFFRHGRAGEMDCRWKVSGAAGQLRAA